MMTSITLPAGWRTLGLLDLVSIRSGQVDPRRPEYRDLPLIAPDHIGSGTGRLLKKQSASSQGAISGKYLVMPGDVIYSKIRPYLQKAVKCDFTALCSADMYPLTPRHGVDGSFVLHTILSKSFTDFATSVSARSGIPKVNRNELAEYRLSVPPVAEQKAISGALDDADQMIAALERLITKRQAIKQGMMLQLLTGKTRLPGFSREWREQQLGSLGTTYGGLTGKTKDDFGVGSGHYVPFMAVMSGVKVQARSLLKVRVARGERQSVVRPGDLLFNTSSETPDELAMCAVAGQLPEKTYLNSFCFGFRLSTPTTADALFLAYLFRSVVGRRLMDSLAQGATRYNLSKAQFRKLVLSLPSLNEQREIASVLRTADDELDILKARLAKTEAIKQGMMQELLTGRTRLPVSEAVA